MNTDTTWQTFCTGSEETVAVAERLGGQLKGGEVIELTSDLGGGKTTFVRGLAHGMGSIDHVSSPTFTVGKEYKSQNLTLHHFDFYRLPEPGIVRHELAEVIDDPHAVVVIEWADLVQDALPDERMTISIRVVDDQTRELTFSFPEKLAYLLVGLK